MFKLIQSYKFVLTWWFITECTFLTERQWAFYFQNATDHSAEREVTEAHAALNWHSQHTAMTACINKLNLIWAMLVTWGCIVTSLSTLPNKLNWPHPIIISALIWQWFTERQSILDSLSGTKHGTLKVPFAHFKRYTRLYICHLHHQVLELCRQCNVCLDALDHQSPNNTLTFPDSKQWVAHWLCRCLHSDDRRHRKGVPTVTVASLSIWRFDIWT